MTRPLAPADFELLREYLRRTAGLEFDEGRRAGLAGIIDERLTASGQPDVSRYVERLAHPDSGVERQRLLDAVTIQETHFHRARPQIEALRRQILPDVLTRAANQPCWRGELCWSVMVPPGVRGGRAVRHTELSHFAVPSRAVEAEASVWSAVSSVNSSVLLAGVLESSRAVGVEASISSAASLSSSLVKATLIGLFRC